VSRVALAGAHDVLSGVYLNAVQLECVTLDLFGSNRAPSMWAAHVGRSASGVRQTVLLDAFPW
jgi:hypothetical protein